MINKSKFIHTLIRFKIPGEKTYNPALILLLTKTVGFSTNRSIEELSSLQTTTPYFEGSSTLVTIIVPSLPWASWNFSIASNGKSQITSEFKTKKGESSFPIREEILKKLPHLVPRMSAAKASGPAFENSVRYSL